MKQTSFRIRLAQLVLALVLLFVAGFVALAVDIVRYGQEDAQGSADAAIVLGAAAWGNKPSPVYRERINEALRLYQQGRVTKIIFTGGTREVGYPSEAEVGRQFAVRHGVAPEAILVDTQSRTTVQNLVQAKEIMKNADIHTVLLVSDPLHMRRVMAIAESLKLSAQPSPTESSRFQSWGTRGKFLWRETWLYLDHLVLGLQHRNGVTSLSQLLQIESEREDHP